VRLLVLLSVLGPLRAWGEPIDCRAAAQAAEQEMALPPGLLYAIGRVETGRPNLETGQVEPWSWSTNMAGISHYFASEPDAIDWTALQLALGQRSIDVGCFQINLLHHPQAFATLEEAFDPLTNARYAARFLKLLYQRTSNWQMAVAQYHSADPMRGGSYGSRVFALLTAGDWPVSIAIRPGIANGLPLADGFERVLIPAGPALYGIQVLVPGWRRLDSPLRGAVMQRVQSPAHTPRRLPRVFTPNSTD
jgi:hypothetical protein